MAIIDYSPTGKTVLISICSGTKDFSSPRSLEYYQDYSIFKRLSKPDLLKNARRTSLKLIQSGRISYNGLPLSQHPNNQALVEGPEFYGDQRGQYLPAMNLYSGRFFENFNKFGGISTLTKSSQHMLIISGLYGLITPVENIQLYECPLEDLTEFQEIWVRNDTLTRILLDYIQTNNISNVVDLTAQQEYRNLINWPVLKQARGLSVLHCHSQRFVRDEALPEFGIFLGKILSQMKDDEIHGIDKDKQIDGICLSKDIIPPSDYPMEESHRIESLIRRHESHTVEFKASLTGGTVDNLDDLEHGLFFNEIKYRVMKSVVALLNSDGGEVLVGVSDDWNGHEHPVIGIENDIRPFILKRDPKDYYLQILDRMIHAYIGKIYKIRPSFWTIHRKTVLQIKVEKSQAPVFLKRDKRGSPILGTGEYWKRQNVGDSRR